jgi:uncharacterized membrane protein (UPF0136 family)
MKKPAAAIVLSSALTCAAMAPSSSYAQEADAVTTSPAPAAAVAPSPANNTATPTPQEAASAKTAPPVISEEVIAAGSDTNQAVDNLSDPVDPVGNPAGFLDKAITWWKAGWSMAFTFLLALGLVTVLASYVPWFGATAQRALATAAGTAFLTEMVVRLSTGSPITFPIVMAAIGIGINTWMTGKKAQANAAKTLMNRAST